MHTLAIVDDNHLLRDHLAGRLHGFYHVVYAGASAADFLSWMAEATDNERPELVLMDIEMDDMDGMEATALLKSHYPQLRVVMLTVFDQEEKVWQSIKAGADGYLLKDESKDRLLSGIEDVLQGGACMSPNIARLAMQMMQQQLPAHVPNEVNGLTRREVEILQLLQTGMSYKAIAEQLYISPHTAKTHIHHIYEKLQVRNKLEASNKAGLPGRRGRV